MMEFKTNSEAHELTFIDVGEPMATVSADGKVWTNPKMPWWQRLYWVVRMTIYHQVSR